MKNILIIGCGLLGSSLLRRISKKKIAKKIFIYEKSKSNILKIRKLKLPGTIVKSLEDGVVNVYLDYEVVSICWQWREDVLSYHTIFRFAGLKELDTESNAVFKMHNW